MVGRERIELSTNGLKGRCSTVELPALYSHRFLKLILYPYSFTKSRRIGWRQASPPCVKYTRWFVQFFGGAMRNPFCVCLMSKPLATSSLMIFLNCLFISISLATASKLSSLNRASHRMMVRLHLVHMAEQVAPLLLIAWACAPCVASCAQSLHASTAWRPWMASTLLIQQDSLFPYFLHFS